MIELIHLSKSPEEQANLFAVRLISWINESSQNEFHIALSGGHTPSLLFELLADKYRESFPWHKAHFWWGDERMVPPDDPESNFGTANELFLSKIPVSPDHVHRIIGEANPNEEAIRYSEEIRSLLPEINQKPAFDLIMLGLGEDGHTASIFPGQQNLLDSDHFTAVSTHPVTSQIRITITGKVINNARKAAFLVTGKTKARVLGKILHHHKDAVIYPAAHIRPVEELHWFIDKDSMPVKPADY